MSIDRHDSLLALTRMRTAIAQVRKHVEGCTMEQFMANKRTSDAVLMQLSVLGEEVRRVDPDLLAKYPYPLSVLGEEVRRVDPDLLAKYPYPWHEVRAQRNVIAHDYFGIRLPSVWANIQQELGPLDNLLKRILEIEIH